MNKKWQNFITKNLESKKEDDLYRILNTIEETSGTKIIIDGKEYINFASNDYINLTSDKRIIDAGYDFAKKWGAGSGSSRLVTGTLLPFIELEKKLASWGSKESALIFNSGYHANIGLLSALADRKTVIFCDKLNHASIYDGILLSRANMARYPHNDMDALKSLLDKHKDADKKIIITDSLFSMEGDIAPIEKIVKLAKEYEALTIVDEAHSFGIFGKNGNGITAECKMANEVDIIMGTLGKSFGAFGAFALIKNDLQEYLINNSRPFIFTTALPPFIIGAVSKALDIIKEETRGKALLKSSEMLRSILKKEKIDTGNSCSHIIPIIVGSNKNALSLMNHLKDNGMFASAIRPPTVPQNTSRIRVSLSYLHKEDEIKNLANIIKKWFKCLNND